MKTSAAKLEAARKYRAKKAQDPKWRAERLAYQRAYKIKHKERIAEQERGRAQKYALRAKLKRKGLPTSLEAVVKVHSGLCDICGSPETGRWPSLNIDHSHASGAFRGLLCTKCNRGLGSFKDDPSLLRKAALYLERSEGGPTSYA